MVKFGETLKRSLVEGSMSLEVNFERLKSCTIPSFFSLEVQDVSS